MLARKTFVGLVCLVALSCSDTSGQSVEPEDSDVRSMPDRSVNDSLDEVIPGDLADNEAGTEDSADTVSDPSEDDESEMNGDASDSDEGSDDSEDAEVIEIPSECGDGIETGESCSDDDDCADGFTCVCRAEECGLTQMVCASS